METGQRSAISVVFLLLLVVTMAAVAASPQDAAVQANDTDGTDGTTSVTVSATGDVQAEPDLAVVDLEVATTATDPQTASERLASNVSRLRTALLEANVSEDQIRTTEYNLHEVREPEGDARGTNETRYRARQVVEVEVSNTSRAGELVDVAVANGASAVRGVAFTLSEDAREDRRNRALEEAMTDARSQAETLAAAEGLQVTGVRSISTDGGGPQPLAAQETAAAGDGGTSIDSGPVTVQASVQVTYNATG